MSTSARMTHHLPGNCRHSPASVRPIWQGCAGSVSIRCKMHQQDAMLTKSAHTVWRLRGWVHESKPKLRNSLQYTSTTNGTIAVAIFSRSDGASAPTYEDVRNLRDGRERLGHNPAEIDKEIGWRMKGVKSREGDRMPFAGDGEHRLASQNGDRAALARL